MDPIIQKIVNQIKKLNTKLIGGERKVELITGSGTWNVPANVYNIDVILIGAGGKGGDSNTGPNSDGGGGGGSGALIIAKNIHVESGESYSYDIKTAAAGGNTTFDDMICGEGGDGANGSGSGGIGGIGGIPSISLTAGVGITRRYHQDELSRSIFLTIGAKGGTGGTGGGASATDGIVLTDLMYTSLDISGGEFGINQSTYGGGGGGAVYGKGGNGGDAETSGYNPTDPTSGTGYGGGGGGAASHFTTVQNGVNGKDGVLIISYYVN